MTMTSRDGWRRVVFGDIVEDSAFGPRFSGGAYSDSGNVRTLRTTDISSDGRISYETMPLAELDETKFETHFLKPGDLVITRSGRIGTAAVFDDYPQPVLPGAFLIRFRLLKDADARYFRYWFNSVEGQHALLSVARGVAQQNINITNVKKLKVPLPPVNTQRAIASILSAYDDLIENNRRRIQLLENAARLLYKEWFVNLRFPGHEHVRIKNGVPEGWKRVKASEILEINPRETVAKNSEIRYVPMASLSESGLTIDLSQVTTRLDPTTVRFRNRDILFARITPCLENGKTAFVDFLPDSEVACGSTEFIVLRGRDVSPYFTYCLARTDHLRGAAIKSMIGSSGRQRVQVSVFDEYSLGLPPESLLTQFDEFASSCFEQIRCLTQQNSRLDESRKLLLVKLMNGDVSV